MLASFPAQRFRAFLHNHDELPAFQAGFIVFTFLAAAFFNLGFFFLLILVHMALDYLKYRSKHGYSVEQSLRSSVIESSVDIALFFVGLVLAAFFRHSSAVIGVSGVLRSQLTVGYALAVLVPKYRIFSDTEQLIVHLHSHLHPSDVYPHAPLTTAQRIAFILIVLCIFSLIAAAPSIVWAQLVARELLPWKL